MGVFFLFLVVDFLDEDFLSFFFLVVVVDLGLEGVVVVVGRVVVVVGRVGVGRVVVGRVAAAVVPGGADD